MTPALSKDIRIIADNATFKNKEKLIDEHYISEDIKIKTLELLCDNDVIRTEFNDWI